MSPQAAKLEAYADEAVVEQPLPEGPGPLDRLFEYAERVIGRVKGLCVRSVPEAQFRWNIPAAKVRTVRPETVYCVELPVSNPVAMLEAYGRAGVASDHVVFVGDGLSLSDDAYDQITRKGALVHETKKGRRDQTERDLKPYFAASRPERRAVLSHPYTYKPGPPKVTPEQLKEFIDAVARPRR